MPPALLCLWNRKPGDNDSAANFLIKLERLAYFLFVARYGVNDRIARFATAMNELDPRENSSPVKGLDLTLGEQAEFIKELDGNIYTKGRVCKAVLQRLDETLSTGGATYDDLVSIEHVLPQTVSEDSEWAKIFRDELTRTDWTHRLANLVFLTRRVNTQASNWDFEKKKQKYFSSDNGSSPFVITQEVLRTEKWTLSHLKERQSRLIQKLADVWALDIEAAHNTGGFSETNSRIGKGFTEASLLDAKRETIVQALAKREGSHLEKTRGAFYSSPDGTVKAICTISKRYTNGSPYWYGYAPQWNDFLSTAKNSYIVLGCMDRNRAYAIPHERISKILPHLHRTGERHWHLALEESGEGQIELSLPRTGSKVRLNEYEVEL